MDERRARALSGGPTILVSLPVNPYATSTGSVRGGAQHATISIAHAWCEWWPRFQAVIVHPTSHADPTPGRPAAAVSTHT